MFEDENNTMNNTTSTTTPNASLATELKALSKALQNSAIGPLLVAGRVMQLSENWGQYETEAEGRSLSSCLVQTLGAGKTLRFFRSRHEAVMFLGESVRRHLHHDAAVWAQGNVPEFRRAAFVEAVAGEWIANGRNPLTTPQVRRIAKRLAS